jgi:NlpC/P60 family putative phage cell wall peptidase
MTPEAIVAAARAWIGTPYRHQASVHGAGADCLGLVRGVWREVRGDEPEAIPPYTADWSEPQHDEFLWREARRWLVEHDPGDARAGDVILFRMARGAVAKHLGIQAACGFHASFIHAYSGHGVIETALSRPWLRRIVARFSFS